MTDMSWETELTELLGELSSAQDELLVVLNRKLELLAATDAVGLEQLLPTEQALSDGAARRPHGKY